MTRTSRRPLFAALFVAALGVMVSGSSLLAEEKCSNCSGRGRGNAHSGDCGCGDGHCADGNCDGQCADGHCRNAGGQMTVDHGHPNLFYNFYVPPTGGVGASLYLSPVPTPPHVGHTYITYQPLMPHEMMYPHHTRYYRYYNGGRGLNRTRIHYYNPPVLSQAHDVLSMFRLAR